MLITSFLLKHTNQAQQNTRDIEDRGPSQIPRETHMGSIKTSTGMKRSKALMAKGTLNIQTWLQWIIVGERSERPKRALTLQGPPRRKLICTLTV